MSTAAFRIQGTEAQFADFEHRCPRRTGMRMGIILSVGFFMVGNATPKEEVMQIF